MKNPAAVALGRLGGLARSEVKTAAVRENAKRGGWPKGKIRGKRKRVARRPNAKLSDGATERRPSPKET